MRQTTTVVVISAAVLAASTVEAQAPPDTTRVLAAAAQLAREIGARSGEHMWPGFRPDTIPVVFVLPERGSWLFNWSGPLPDGYVALPDVAKAGWRDGRAPGAASTGTTLGTRAVAQVAVSSFSTTFLVPTAVHEAFHVFQRASTKPGRRFGRGELSSLVSRYPVFDADLEAAFALEGRILAAALRATTLAARRELGRQFSAVREERHRRLPHEFAEFDAMAELNEGLAEYVLVRTLTALDSPGAADARALAGRAIADRAHQLDSLTTNVRQSVRLRFYGTGPAIALLLDRMEGPAWKRRLIDEDLTLHEMLARASGFHAGEVATRERAEQRFSAERLLSDARDNVERVKELRRRQVDSILARPGILLVVDAKAMSQRDVGICGYDPQNLFRASPTVEIHMRWVRPCNTNTTFGEFNTPVVHDEEAGTISAVIGSETEVAVTVGGRETTLRDGDRLAGAADVKLTTPVATYQAGKADVERAGRVLRLRLLLR